MYRISIVDEYGRVRVNPCICNTPQAAVNLTKFWQDWINKMDTMTGWSVREEHV